jgi:hypothetical protein
MLDKVVFLGCRVVAMSACAAVCRRVRALSGSPRARNCRPVLPGLSTSVRSAAQQGRARQLAGKLVRS